MECPASRRMPALPSAFTTRGHRGRHPEPHRVVERHHLVRGAQTLWSRPHLWPECRFLCLADACMAVGHYFGQTSNVNKNLAEWWDGTTWSLAPSPSRGAGAFPSMPCLVPRRTPAWPSAPTATEPSPCPGQPAGSQDHSPLRRRLGIRVLAVLRPACIIRAGLVQPLAPPGSGAVPRSGDDGEMAGRGRWAGGLRDLNGGRTFSAAESL